MARILNLVLALALVACAAIAYADPPSRVGRVNYMNGAVSFAPAEAPDQWVQATLNRPLTSGDRLWADNNSRAELHVGSTALHMGAQTSLDVLNLDDHILQLRLAQGAINIRVRELAENDRIEIATPSGAVVIREPGSYRVSADPRSNTGRVAVNFGQADIVTPTQTFTVPSSQAATFAVDANPSFEAATYASADDFDRWSAERDRREDRVMSTRYVSPQTTGYEDLDQYGAWRTLPEYGTVWVPASVAADWAPYRYGHWVWISPWGWTWVDDAPWGFAPFHYGRWVWLNSYWAWAPGRFVAHPVYAPALVAFVGVPAASFSFAIGSGPAVGWFPLGWREPYFPAFHASPTFVRNVNITHVTNVTNVTNIYNNSTRIENIRFVNRNNPRAVTVVPQQAFVSAQPVARSAVRVAPAQLARASVIRAQPPAQPVRASFAPERSGQRPASAAVAREVVAVTAPAKPVTQATLAPRDTAQAQPRGVEQEPRVRVIGRERAQMGAANRVVPQSTAPQALAPAKEGTPAPMSGNTAQVAPSAAARPPQAAPRIDERARSQSSPRERVAQSAPARRGPPPTSNVTAREAPVIARPPQAGPVVQSSPPVARATDEASSGSRRAAASERRQTASIEARPEVRPPMERGAARREPPRAEPPRPSQAEMQRAPTPQPQRAQRFERPAQPRAEQAAQRPAPLPRAEPSRPAQAQMQQRAPAPQAQPQRAQAPRGERPQHPAQRERDAAPHG